MQRPVTRRRFPGASTLAPAAIGLNAAPAVGTPAIPGGAKICLAFQADAIRKMQASADLTGAKR